MPTSNGLCTRCGKQGPITYDKKLKAWHCVKCEGEDQADQAGAQLRALMDAAKRNGFTFNKRPAPWGSKNQNS